MGCDIHLYVEYKAVGSESKEVYWNNCGREMGLHRNYWLFWFNEQRGKK